MDKQSDSIRTAKSDVTNGVTFAGVMQDQKTAVRNSKITADDFETYAAKAVTFADQHHFGVVDKDDLRAAVLRPDPAQDQKTREAMKFLLDHYNFMQNYGDHKDVFKIKGDARFAGMSGGVPLFERDDPTTVTKYGITLDTIDTVSSILDGKRVPSWEQLNGQRGYEKGLMVTGGLIGSAIGGTAAGAFLAGTELCGLAVVGGVVGLVAAPVVALGAAGYYAAVQIEKNNYRLGLKAEYNSFLSDISGTEKIRRQYLES